MAGKKGGNPTHANNSPKGKGFSEPPAWFVDVTTPPSSPVSGYVADPNTHPSYKNIPKPKGGK